MVFQCAIRAAFVASCLFSLAFSGRFSDVRKAQEKRHAEQIAKHHAKSHYAKRQDNSTDYQFLTNATQRKAP